jgi:hypothetical protein
VLETPKVFSAAPGAGHDQFGLGVAIFLDELCDAEQRVRLAVKGAFVLEIKLRGLDPSVG